MSFKHFCHVCNVKFHRAIDFIKHKHKDVKPVVESLIGPLESKDD